MTSDEQATITELRPIGAEFWYYFPLDPRNPAGRQTRCLYRIIEHSEVCHSTHPGAPTYPAERLEPLRMQWREPIEIGMMDFGASGQRIPVPTKFSDWKDLK